jgi:hypothetical protein
MLPIEQQFVEDSGPDIGTFDAAFDLAMMDTFATNVARSGLDTFGISGSLDELEKTTRKVLSPEEANNLYTDVEKPFSQPINEAVAFHLNEEGKKRKLLQQKISEGPGGNFYKGAINLGAGIIAHALDPVEFGVGAFAGMGLGALGGVAAAGKFGQSAIKAGQVLSKGGFAAEAAEGIVGNAILEPAMYQYSQEAQVDYTVEDAFISIVGGGLAAPVAIHSAKAGFNQLKKISPNSFGLGIKTSIGQFHAAKIPEPELIYKHYKESMYKQSTSPEGSVRANYSFEKRDAITLKENSVYMTPSAPDDISSNSRVIGDYMGDGYYMTDNPTLANNMATNPLEEMTSNVFEMDIKELNIKDADMPDRAFIDSLDLPKQIQDILYEVDSIKDAQNYIRNAIDEGVLDDTDFDLFMESVKNQGVEGLKFTDEQNGHNGLFIYPESISKAKELNRYDADTKNTPMPDRDTLRQEAKKAEENVFEHDKAAQKEFDSLPDPKDVTPEERKLYLDNTLKTLEDMEALGLITDPDELAVIKQIKESQTKDQELLEAAEAFANCKISGAD